MKDKKTKIKNSDLPATQGMLYELRNELKSDMTSLELRIRAEFQTFGAKFQTIDATFQTLFGEIQKLAAEVQKQSSLHHRTLALMEEQKANNRYLFDGLAMMMDRQTRLETRVDRLEKQKN